MIVDELLIDPVFQLNLLLWMAKEQPSDNYRVRPLLYQAGFRLIYIEQPFAFPVETATAIQNSQLNISLEPEPEMIVGRERDQKALYFEAKANSFSPQSDNSRQARGHLLACGTAFGEVLAPLESCLLCYVTPADKCELMSECLGTLAEQLKQADLKPGEFSAHGLSIREGEIVYSWDDAFRTYVSFPDNSISIMSGVTGDVNPTPLLLLYSDEDHHDPAMQDYYRHALIEQVRACMLCELQAHPIQVSYARTPDQLLAKTSGDLFQYYGRKRATSLRRLVKQNIFKRIIEYWKEKQRGITLSDNELRIYWGVSGEKEEFLNWLEDRRIKFSASKPKPEQQDSGTLPLDFPPENEED